MRKDETPTSTIIGYLMMAEFDTIGNSFFSLVTSKLRLTHSDGVDACLRFLFLHHVFSCLHRASLVPQAVSVTHFLPMVTPKARLTHSDGVGWMIFDSSSFIMFSVAYIVAVCLSKTTTMPDHELFGGVSQSCAIE
jgi:hypothetical protein